MGLKPPSRGRMVETGGLTTVEVETRWWASGSPLWGVVVEVDVEALLGQVNDVEVLEEDDDVSWSVLTPVKSQS